MDATPERTTKPMSVIELFAAVGVVGAADSFAAGSRRMWAPFYLCEDSVMLAVTGLMAFALHAPLVHLAVSGVRREAVSAALPGVVWATVVWLCALPLLVVAARPNVQACWIAPGGIVGTATAVKLRCRVSLGRAVVPALYAGAILGSYLVACSQKTISE